MKQLFVVDVLIKITTGNFQRDRGHRTVNYTEVNSLKKLLPH